MGVWGQMFLTEISSGGGGGWGSKRPFANKHWRANVHTKNKLWRADVQIDIPVFII